MAQLSTIALWELNEVTVVISEPIPFEDNVLNVREGAFIKVTVTNNSNSVLRDLVADTVVCGSAYISPVSLWGWTFGTGDWYRHELDPGAKGIFIVTIMGDKIGNAHVDVSLCAEIVPFACNNHIAFSNFFVADK